MAPEKQDITAFGEDALLWAEHTTPKARYLSEAFNMPPARVSLGIRRFLVVLRYAQTTLYFRVKSDEARTEQEARRIAIDRVESSYVRADGRDIALGNLLGSDVHPDTEESLAAAGVRDVGYPRRVVTRLPRWHNAPKLGRAA